MKELRKLRRARYPLGLAGFPYVDYHPSFPYSVFLGPGGAQQNLPQLYWHTIGTTVAYGYAHTYTYNRIYGRPLEPLGQTYANPPAREVKLFRRYARAYRIAGLSWWDWQETGASSWRAIGARHLNRVEAWTERSSTRPSARRPRGSGRLGAGAPERRRLRCPGGRQAERRDLEGAVQVPAPSGIPARESSTLATWKRLLRVQARDGQLGRHRHKSGGCESAGLGKPAAGSQRDPGQAGLDS